MIHGYGHVVDTPATMKHSIDDFLANVQRAREEVPGGEEHDSDWEMVDEDDEVYEEDDVEDGGKEQEQTAADDGDVDVDGEEDGSQGAESESEGVSGGKTTEHVQ
jgi:hypothetical protein